MIRDEWTKPADESAGLSDFMAAQKPKALIFRTQLLPYSETFIRNQAESLRRFTPFYVGMRRIAGLELPTASTWVANEGGLKGLASEARFTYFGPGSACLRRLEAVRPRLIHAHFGPDGSEAVALKNALRIPLIVTYHGYDATLSDAALDATRQGRMYLRKRAKLLRQVSQFIAVSGFIKERMIAQGFPAEKILVHYIGVGFTAFHRSAASDPALRVLFTGRLTEKKGCLYLLKAMAGVQQKLPQAELIVIGDGPDRPALEEQARAMGVRCTFMGRQPPEVVKERMQKATLFCVPSITAANGDAEGFGIVFAEAQACGLPVVSFSSGGVPEAVAHGETGLLAPEKDWQTLAGHILLLLQNADLRQQFSHAGRLRVNRLFNLGKQTALLEDIYAEVVANKLNGR